MGIHDYSAQESVASAYGASTLSASSGFSKCRAVHCNTGATYLATFESGISASLTMSEGIYYPYCLTNLTKTNTSAVDTGSIVILY
ncbi:MAG: hypothetical protein H8E13_03375 [Actinobacteria bacterium]|nr:hypothetical protein [Actinomycetota bacterium]